VCCQVQVFASGWSLALRIPTEYGGEASTMRRPWPTTDCSAMGRGKASMRGNQPATIIARTWRALRSSSNAPVSTGYHNNVSRLSNSASSLIIRAEMAAGSCNQHPPTYGNTARHMLSFMFYSYFSTGYLPRVN